MNSQTVIWGCCDDRSEEDKFERCGQCDKAFHYNCLSQQDLRKNNKSSTWKCPTCTLGSRSNKRPALSPPESGGSGMARDDYRDMLRDILREERSEWMRELKSNLITPLTEDIKSMKEEIKCFRDSMEFINAKYEELKTETLVGKKAVSDIKEEHSVLRESIKNFDSRINHLEQQARLRNVEIQCLPEKKTENLLETVAKISEAIGCEVKPVNIERCSRIAKMNRSSDRPRSVIVQFDTRNSKDSFLASVFKYNKANPSNKLNTAHLGLGGVQKPIYVMEHLSASNKALHAATRLKAKQLGYKFVWVRDGKIFVRKTEESSFVVINSPETLEKLV